MKFKFIWPTFIVAALGLLNAQKSSGAELEIGSTNVVKNTPVNYSLFDSSIHRFCEFDSFGVNTIYERLDNVAFYVGWVSTSEMCLSVWAGDKIRRQLRDIMFDVPYNSVSFFTGGLNISFQQYNYEITKIIFDHLIKTVSLSEDEHTILSKIFNKIESAAESRGVQREKSLMDVRAGYLG